MPSYALSPAVLQQLRRAVAGALAELTSDGTTVLGERREVAALAVHLALGSGSKAEAQIDSAPWIDIAMRLVLAVVQRYGGTVESFEASGVLAFFGVPYTHEDDLERAGLAALAIRLALEPIEAQMRSQHGLALILRMGLHLGSAIHGHMGFGETDYTVIGDTAVHARALQALAESGTALASAAYYERTKTRFAYQAKRDRAGGAAEVGHALVRATLPVDASTKGQPVGTMIGRAAEREALSAALHELHRAPCGRVVLIRGEAGIGKSRLVAELQAELAGAQRSFYTIRCNTLDRVKPLALAAELLRALFGLTLSQPVAAQRECCAVQLARLGLGADDLLPYIDYVLGLTQGSAVRHERLRAFDPAMLQRQLHLVLRRIVLAGARLAPTALVVEDLQWIDPASRDFFEYLIQTTRTGHDAQLLLILVTRDNEPASMIQPLIAAAARNPQGIIDLALPPLTHAESGALVGQLLPRESGLWHTLIGQIGARAAGNPLFIEELVHMLREQGALSLAGAGLTALREAEALLHQVPDTLQGLLIARFSILPERLRRVLQRAAVLGRSFPLRLLDQLESGPLALLRAELDELGARQILNHEPDEGNQRYAFQTAMLQEAIYQTLLLPDRQRLHSQAAQAVAGDSKLADHERAQLLAYHYAESTTPSLALPYLIETAERSARRYANETAIQHYRRALSLLSERANDHQMLVVAQIGLGRVLKFTGQYAEAAQLLGAAVTILRGAGAAERQPLLLAEALRELAETHQRDGNLHLAVVALTEGLDLLEGAPAPAAQAQRRALLERLAAVLFRQGDLEAAHSLATEATADLSLLDADDPITLASLFNILGGVLWQRGDLLRANESVEQSLRLYERVGYAWGMATAYTNLGILNHTLGRWRQAAEHFQRSDELRKEIGYVPERAVNLKNLGVLQIEMGLHEQARQNLEASLSMSRGIGDDYGIVIAVLQLADLALLQQRAADARALLAEAASLLTAAGEDERILFLWLRGLAEEREGRYEPSIALVREALELAQTAGVPELEIDCRRVLGSLEGKCGRFADAERELQAALTLSIEQASAFREGLARYELGWHHLRLARQQIPPDPAALERANVFYAQALERFLALDARHDIQRARSALKLLR